MTGTVARSFIAAALMLIASGVTPSFASAQAAPPLRGRVVDANTRAPLEGAEIIVVSTGVRTRSGADGSWKLARVPAGHQQIRIRRVGYSSSTVTLAVPSDTGVAISLAPSVRALDALVVTASRRAQRLQDVPVMMDLIDRNDIKESGASDVASVLTEQTGIQFTGGHPSGSGVGLEGMSDQRVLILLDGVPLYGRIADGLDVTRVPTTAIERIEVVKGPQSTLYGSEAMGGVVNIITRDPGSAPPDLDASLILGNDRRVDASLYGTTRIGSLAASGGIGTRHIDRTPGIAGVSGAFADRRDGMGTVRWTPSSALTLNASGLVVSERQRWPSGGANDFADNTQGNAKVMATWMNATSRLTSTLGFSELDHLSRTSQYADPIAGTGDRQLQRMGQADVLYTRNTQAAVFDLGLQLRQEYIMSTDGRIAGGSRTLSSAEPYAQAEWSHGRLSIVPGARVSWSEQFGTYVSPRVALRFRVDSSLTLRASAGRGFRAPDFKELYLDFTNDAAFYAVHGNPALRPEHSDNMSLAAEWAAARSYARTLVYLNNLRDFIETEPLPNSGQFAQYTYGNIDRSTTRGAELETGTVIGDVHLDAGYAYLYSRNRETDGPLLGQPSHSGRLRVSGPLPFRIRASAIAVYTGRTPMDRAADGSISSTRDAYSRLDLRVARPVLDHTELSIGVNNVFNAMPAHWADDTSRQVYAGITWHVRDMTNHAFR